MLFATEQFLFCLAFSHPIVLAANTRHTLAEKNGCDRKRDGTGLEGWPITPTYDHLIVPQEQTNYAPTFDVNLDAVHEATLEDKKTQNIQTTTHLPRLSGAVLRGQPDPAVATTRDDSRVASSYTPVTPVAWAFSKTPPPPPPPPRGGRGIEEEQYGKRFIGDMESVGDSVGVGGKPIPP